MAESSVSQPESFHILVVDDEKGVLETLCELIQSAGYRVTGVSSAREALNQLRETPVDLVLTDLMMPEVNGWQLLRMRLARRFTNTPILCLTAFEFMEIQTPRFARTSGWMNPWPTPWKI